MLRVKKEEEKNMRDKRAKENRTNGRINAGIPGNPELGWAIRAGITDGSRLGDYATREETALMIAAALRYWTGCVFKVLNRNQEES